MLDGRSTRTVISFKSENILIQRQLDGKPVTIVREFSEDELIMVSYHNKWQMSPTNLIGFIINNKNISIMINTEKFC